MRFAIIGCAGYIARRHMDIIQKLGHRIVAACDPTESVGHLDKYGLDISFNKISNNFWLECKKVEAETLVVCTPNHLHAQHIKNGLVQGMNVICEKPICMNSKEIGEIMALEKKTGRRVMAVLQMRHHPDVKRLKDVLPKIKTKDGRLYCHMNYFAPRGNWYTRTWKGDPKKSGGILMNIGVHMIDMLIQVFGPLRAKKIVMADNHAEILFTNDEAHISAVISTDARHNQQRTLDIAEWEHQFSFNNISNLHEQCYMEFLDGRGPGIKEAAKSIKLIESVI